LYITLCGFTVVSHTARLLFPGLRRSAQCGSIRRNQ